jgi:hypothetical protein
MKQETVSVFNEGSTPATLLIFTMDPRRLASIARTAACDVLMVPIRFVSIYKHKHHILKTSIPSRLAAPNKAITNRAKNVLSNQ